MKKIMMLLLIIPALSIIFADQPKEAKKLVFEEQRIEGKIRRPQLVLIKADQRPDFKPMAIQSYGKLANVIGSINEKVIDESPYSGPFMFDGTKIKNYVP